MENNIDDFLRGFNAGKKDNPATEEEETKRFLKELLAKIKTKT